LLEQTYTYKYLAQATELGSPDAYGSDAYGQNAYSCAASDLVCQTEAPGAPNTGFLATSNPVVMGGIVVTVALVVTIVAYAIIRKVKHTKAVK
jgi:hypothetical protein